MQLRNFWQRPSSHVTPCPSHGASTLTLQVGTTPSFSRTGVPLPGQRLKGGRCRGGPGRETAGAAVSPGLLPGGPAASIASAPPLRAPVLTPEPSRNQTRTFPDHLQKRMCRNHGELWRHRAERGVQTRRAPGAFHTSSSHPSRPRGASPRGPGKPCAPRSWPQRQASPRSSRLQRPVPRLFHGLRGVIWGQRRNSPAPGLSLHARHVRPGAHLRQRRGTEDRPGPRRHANCQAAC